MLKGQTKIAPLDLSVLLVNIAFGAGILTLPRAVADAAKEDMWLAVMLSGILIFFSLWCATKLAGLYPDKTCMEYHCLVFGRVVGMLLNAVLLIILLLYMSFALIVFVTALRSFLLDLTPPPFIYLPILFLAVYAGQYGFLPLVRMQRFITMFNYIIFFPIILLGLLAVTVKYFQPALVHGFSPILKASLPSWFSYSGPEMIIGFIYPFLTNQQSALKWGMGSVAFLVIAYTMIVAIVQGILGPAETAYILIPTIIAYRSVEIPDTFIERLDGYLMIVWILVYFNSLANLMFFFSFGVQRVLKLEYIRPILILALPVVYYLANIPPNFLTSIAMANVLNIISLVWGVVVIPGMLLFAVVKRKNQQ